MSFQAAITSPWGLSTPSPHTTVRGFTSSCMPAMRSWKTRALAMMAQAMRRVWGTLVIPSRRAMAVVTPERVSFSSSKSLAAPSIPSWSVVVARSTARWGTDTKRTMSATSSTAPSSQPDSGKRLSPPSSVKTQYPRRADDRAARRSWASLIASG